MRLFDERYSIDGVATQLRREAFKGVYRGGNGENPLAYLETCTALHAPSWAHIRFNREEGNYEFMGYRTFMRCFTLILTFVDPATRQKTAYNSVRAHPWVVALFGPMYEAAWIEKGTVGDPSRALHLWADELWRPIGVPNREQEEALTRRLWVPYEYPDKSTCIDPETTVQSNCSA